MFNLQVEALAVQLTHREGELVQEKAEVKKLTNFLKQVMLTSSISCFFGDRSTNMTAVVESRTRSTLTLIKN